MKKIALLLVATLGLLNAEIEFEVGSNMVKTKETTFLGIQPLSELTGADGNELYVGAYKRFDNVSLGLRYTNAEGNEHRLELRTKIDGNTGVSNLKWFVGVAAGGGFQGEKELTISTNITPASYITSGDLNTHKIDTKIETDKLNYLNFGISGGLAYLLSENLSLNAGVESTVKYWNVEYTLKDSGDSVSMSGERQSSINTFIALNYKF